MTNEEAKGRLESFIDTFNICKEHDNSLVDVSIGKEDIQAFTMAIRSLEADRTIEKVLYAIREEMQYIKVAELQIYGKASWRFTNAIEDIINKHLQEVENADSN